MQLVGGAVLHNNPRLEREKNFTGETSLSKAGKPGKVMSKPLLSSVPLVVSTRNVPEKAQSSFSGQESKVPPEKLLAKPDTPNVVIASARMRADDIRTIRATRPGNTNRLRNEHKRFFIVHISFPPSFA